MQLSISRAFKIVARKLEEACFRITKHTTHNGRLTLKTGSGNKDQIKP